MSRKEVPKIEFKKNLKIIYDLSLKYKWMAIFLIVMIILLEGVRLAEKYLYKIIIDKSTEFIGGTLILESFLPTLILIAVIFLGMRLFDTVGNWFKVHYVIKFEIEVLTDLKVKFFNHIIGLSHKFHSDHKTGSLISILSRGTRAIEHLYDFLIWNLAPVIINFIIVGGTLIYFDPTSAIITLIIFVVFLTYSFFILENQKKLNVLANKAEDAEKANISDMLTNVETIKFFGKEDKVKRIFHKVANTTKDAFARHWNTFRWFDAGHVFIIGIGFFFIFFFAMQKIISGDMTIGTLVFIYAIYGNVIFPLFRFVHGVRGFYRSMADFQELFEYDKVRNDIEDKTNAKTCKLKKGTIEFRNINFAYVKKNLFENFNLKIKSGEKVALVGHSGCGKTTLIKLLYRLYDVQKGKILVDGKDIKEYKQESLRSEMSVVPQECILFDDTVYNNIKFSHPSATREEVLEAIKFAQLDTIINDFPQKEKTIVGERGIKLSGGEKQRVSIARAVLANKKVLVLDEATSSLDSETEYEIQKALEDLLKGKTAIMIAHRLSTIMNSDRIIVMDKGKIVQMGKHKNLIKQKGQYKKLWNLQKGGYLK